MAVRERLLQWDSQPQEAVEIDQKWLNRGLAFVSKTVDRNDVNGENSAMTGSVVRPYRNGLMRGYGGTLGAGTTDKAITTYTADVLQKTYVMRYYRNGAGGGSLARLFTKQTSGTEFELLFTNDTAGPPSLDYQRAFSGGTNATRFANIVDGEYGVLALSFDASSPTSVADLWKNGLRQTPLSNSTTTGTVTANTQALSIGNRPSDNARVWNGLLGDLMVFHAILTDDEKRELTQNPSAVWAPQRIWVPTPAAGLAFNPFSQGFNPIRGFIQ